MALLSISVLGNYSITWNGKSVFDDFESQKVRALLAYLVIESGKRHQRQALAEFFWPNRPLSSSLANLRHALYDMKKVLQGDHPPPSPVETSRETIWFNQASDYWLDLEEFSSNIQNALDFSPNDNPLHIVKLLDRAIALYRGPLLDGFSFQDSANFDEWITCEREGARRQMIDALHRAAAGYQKLGNYADAQTRLQRLLQIEPWDETAHRQLMELLYWQGNRSAALHQYETCRRQLALELNIEPEEETLRLMEHIRTGTLAAAPKISEDLRLKNTLENASTQSTPAGAPNAAKREFELNKLNGALDSAANNAGNVLFISGEAGSGKTTLLNMFLQSAIHDHPDALIAIGSSNARSGIGDPFSPFIEILQMLTGNLHPRLSNQKIAAAHAHRLKKASVDILKILLEEGPDLLTTLLQAKDLLPIAETYKSQSPETTRNLKEIIQQSLEKIAPNVGSQQMHLFDQVLKVFRKLSCRYLLVLALEDLHWVDSSSLSLLFHLGRRLAGSRILMVGTFRQEEAATHTDPGHYHLESVIRELQTQFDAVQIDLNESDGLLFVDSVLDLESNRLGGEFRQTLYRHTLGHPLFTVELLRGLQERGGLYRSQDGHWEQKPDLDWDILPKRVEAVIAERMDRLPKELQKILSIASVEGEEFTAEVVAHILGSEEAAVIQTLSADLSQKYHMVNAIHVQRLDGKRLSRYRFRHYLFYKFLYDQLDEIEQVHLNETIGLTLEGFYQGNEDKLLLLGPRLASYFERAGMIEKTIPYLQKAGERAFSLSANTEAIASFKQALTLLKQLPASEHRTAQELRLQLSLGAAQLADQYWGSSALDQTYARAYVLCQEIGGDAHLFQTLASMAHFSWSQGNFSKALALGKQQLARAEKSRDAVNILAAHWMLGENYYFLGEIVKADEHFAAAIQSPAHPQEHALTVYTGVDIIVSCLAYRALTLWALGFPEKGLQSSQQALDLAKKLDHKFTIGFSLAYSEIMIHYLEGNTQMLHQAISSLNRLACKNHLPFFQALGTFFQGWEEFVAGCDEHGLAKMFQGMADWKKIIFTQPGRLAQLLILSDALLKSGKPQQGLSAVNEALELLSQTGGKFYEAELYRLKGNLLFSLKTKGAARQAEEEYRRAISLAQAQQARSWQLRAVLSLCPLLQARGKGDEALDMISKSLSEFTEGFETEDLKKAKALQTALQKSILLA